MDIFYTANDGYVPHLAASICSLCENNKQAENLHFHFLSMGVKPDNLAQLRQMIEQYARKFTVYEIGDVQNQFSYHLDTGGYDPSILGRLFMDRFLPKEIDKVLYLDCDTIIVDSLEDLWSTDLTGYVIGAVSEPTIAKSHKALINFAPEDLYFNSGVLLINLKAWRQQHCEQTILEFYSNNKEFLRAPDQDAINAVLHGQIKELSPRFNFRSIEIYYPYKTLKRISKPAPYLSEAVYNEAKKHPAIIHYLGEERPWRVGCTHPYTNEYDRYLNMTYWKNTPKEQGWSTYFFLFGIFNALTRPCRSMRWRVINGLRSSMMKWRARQLKKQKK